MIHIYVNIKDSLYDTMKHTVLSVPGTKPIELTATHYHYHLSRNSCKKTL